MPSTLATITTATLAAALATVPATVVRRVSEGGFVNAVSGGTVGGSQNNRAVLWVSARAGVRLVDVQPEGAAFSAINGRSGMLSVGVAGTAPLAQWAVLWRGMAAETLPVPFTYATARAVATDGVQVVGSATETDPERGLGSTHGLLWDLASGAVTDLGNDATLTGVAGGVQVGSQLGSNGSTAALWRGAANTVVDLHVAGQDVSVATGTDGAIEVGYVGLNVRVRHEGRPRDIRFYSAGFWSGTAESFVFLASPYRHSFATAVAAGMIVGYGETTDVVGFPIEAHAAAWVGPDHTFVDLHALLPADMRTSHATAVDEAGNIVGWGVTTTGQVRSYLWSARTLEVAQPQR